MKLQKQQPLVATAEAPIRDNGSSSKCNRFGPLQADHEQPKMAPIRRKFSIFMFGNVWVF